VTLPDRGRMAKPVELLSIRPITKDDLPRITKPRDKSATIPQRLRESHHFIARLLALGYDLAQASAATGYSMNRISQLAQAPAMIEQIALYRGEFNGKVVEQLDTFAHLAVQNMIAAERQINDTIADSDDENELLPLRELREIVKDRADRFGYGKHTTSTNVNVDFASRLEAAIQRSGKQPTQIKAHQVAPDSGPQLGPRAQPLPPSMPSVLPFKGPLRRLA
jgi:hypothetical protein